MSMSFQTRRELLRRVSALSCVGAAASTFGFQLATMGEAAAQTANDYRAIVCIFMFGGNDANNMVLATDQDSWGRYFSTRNSGSAPIALMPAGTPATAIGQVNSVTGRTAAANMPEAWGGVIPISSATPNPVPPGTSAGSRTFALHPHLAPLAPIWQSGRLAVAANVGPLIQPTTKAQYAGRTAPLPANLQSHNDQQATWQSGAAEGATRGWGGLLADQLLSSNGQNSVFTAMSTSGNTVFLAGANVVQYQVSTNNTPAIRIGSAASNTSSVFGSANAGARVREIIRDTSASHYLMKDYSTKVVRSQDTADLLNATFASASILGVPGPTQMVNPITRGNENNGLAVQLHTVAKAIAANAELGIKRQVFFVSIGGFDTHDTQNTQHPQLMARLAHGMAYFDQVLGNLNGVDRRSQVTTFTASDFSRTFTTNGDGTDHAWGAHHFVMGGAVRGGSVHGQFPTVGVDVKGGFQNPDLHGNVMVPTMSVDQYAGTMGRWFGASDASISSIFPNLKNFSKRYMDFLAVPTA